MTAGSDTAERKAAFRCAMTGGGVRARVSDRVILGAEARVGWETHLRVNGFVGFTL